MGQQISAGFFNMCLWEVRLVEATVTMPTTFGSSGMGAAVWKGTGHMESGAEHELFVWEFLRMDCIEV